MPSPIANIIGNKSILHHVLTGLSLGVILIFFLLGCTIVTNESEHSYFSSPSSTATELPSRTPTLTQTSSPTRTPVPSVTSTATLIPTQTPIPHPMSILAARLRTYPGSAITIEHTLAPGANYSRYLVWYESDGLKIYGLLTIPSGEMPVNGWPAIVFNHGYIAPFAYQTAVDYMAHVDLLSRNGYIVFKIDYRGHGFSQGEAKGAYGDPGYTTDVLNAVAALKTIPQVNSQKIGMWGHSMGGFLTLRSMVISKDIKAGVIWSGVVGSYPDMLCCWRFPAPAMPTQSSDPNIYYDWRGQWIKVFGPPEVNPEFWMEISANTYLSDLSGPLQLQHDVGDSDVPVKFSQELYQQILAAGKTAEYYEYPGDDHNLVNYFNQAMQRTIEFFDRYLKDGK